MTLGNVKRLCLALLEQDIDTNVMEESLDNIEENDVFKEYLNNMDGAIFNAISRLVTNKKLPIVVKIIGKSDFDSGLYQLPEDTYQFKELAAMTKDGVNGNIKYQVIGKTLYLPQVQYEKYLLMYHPRFFYFDKYAKLDGVEDINEIELSNHNLPDELAINIRYAVYGDMKTEENSGLALNYKNYFEAILNEKSVDSIINHSVQVGENYGY